MVNPAYREFEIFASGFKQSATGERRFDVEVFRREMVEYVERVR